MIFWLDFSLAKFTNRYSNFFGCLLRLLHFCIISLIGHSNCFCVILSYEFSFFWHQLFQDGFSSPLTHSPFWRPRLFLVFRWKFCQTAPMGHLCYSPAVSSSTSAFCCKPSFSHCRSRCDLSSAPLLLTLCSFTLETFAAILNHVSLWLHLGTGFLTDFFLFVALAEASTIIFVDLIIWSCSVISIKDV